MARAAALPPAPPSTHAPPRPGTSDSAGRGSYCRHGRVATGVVLAAHDVPTEGRRAAALDRAHHLELAEAQVTAVGLTPSRPVVAEDIRDLQGSTAHAGPALCRRPLL